MTTGREVAVVTGAASGFGRALTEEFAQRGMDVVLLDRDGGRAEEAAARLAAAHGVDALGMGVDVADVAQVDGGRRRCPSGSGTRMSWCRTSASSSSAPSNA